jgi:CheY-like chemotaxis protein
MAATASASLGDFEEALASGMNDVLVKPFSMLDLERMPVKHLPMKGE